ncbi:MAG: PAS domain S-box protein [Lentimicrobium sp.]|jgi:PAS domain S-box-containing protein|nr:PAS domain S-box protein [Lentimicrobium sp.]
MDKNILDLLNLEKVNSLLEGFNKITGFATAILDLEGNVVSKSGWRQICTEFHRKNPETLKNCSISDMELSGKLAKGEKYHFYKCLNGLIDVAVPVKINGKHIANLFAGQFLFEEPDQKFFKKQAAKYGFDEEKYLSALEVVPVVSKENVKTTLDFLLNMVQMISEATYQKKEQIEITEALEQSEVRWQFALEGNGDGLWDWNVQTNEIFFSKNWKEMLGYHENEIENKFAEWDKRVHPDDKTGVYEAIREHMDGITDVYTNEYRMLCNDGSYKWILDRGKIITRNSENKPLRFIGTHTDITVRRNAEEALLESEAKYKALYDSAPLSYQSLNEDGTFKDINPRWLFVLGYQRKEVIGKLFFDFLHPESRRKAEQEIFPEFKKCGSITGVEFKIRHKQGHYIDISYEGCASYNLDGSFKQTYCVFQDITTKKLAEKNLRISEEKFRSIFEQAGDAMYLSDFDGNIQLANKNACEMLGYDLDELHKMNVSDLDIDLNIPEKQKQFWESLLPGQPQTIETRHKHKNGKIIPVEIRLGLFETGDKKNILGFARDISEQKKAGEALRESEEKFKLAFLTSPDSVNINRLEDGQYIDINTSFTRLTGFTREETLGKTSGEINIWAYPEDRSQLVAGLKETGKVENLEAKFILKDGRMIDGLMSASIISINNVPHILSITRDITELKSAEKALRESEIKFRNVFEKSVDAIGVSKQGIHIFINPMYLSLFGYSESSEIIGRSIYDLIAPSSREDVLRNSKQRASGLFVINTYETRGLKKDGSEFDMDVHASEYEINGEKFTLVILRDITERKQSEEKLQKSEEKFRTFSQISPVGIFVTDVEGKTIYWNDKHAEITGMPIEEGQGTGWVECIHPDDKNRVMNEWYKSTESRSKFDLMYRFKNRQGKITWVIGQAAPMHDKNGELIGFLGNIVDITKLKQAEDELQKYKEHLEELVNERTKDLEIKMSEIERMNKLFIGRELRMKELKDIIKDLEEKLKTC